MSEKTPAERFVEATSLLNALCADLAGHLVTLSPTDRRHTVRPPGELVDHLRQMNDAVRRVPHVAAFLEVDLETVEPAISQLVALESALRATQYLLQRLEDTRTSLRAQLWDATLLTYGTCKNLTRRDPSYLVVVDALAPAFKRTRKADKEETTKGKDKEKAKAKDTEEGKEKETTQTGDEATEKEKESAAK